MRANPLLTLPPAEYGLLRRAYENGTVAALRTRGYTGEITAAKRLVERGLAEKIGEGKTFLRIQPTPKGTAFMERPGARETFKGRASHTYDENAMENPFHSYRGFRYYASAGVYRLTLPDGSKASFGAKQGGVRGLQNYVDAYIEVAVPSYPVAANPRALSKAEKAQRAKKRPVTPRSLVLLSHIERRGAGAGKHHTRTRDEETGRARRPKHGGRDAYVERENPLSGRAGLHIVAKRRAPDKRGAEYSFSYSTRGPMTGIGVTPRGGTYATRKYGEDWKANAEDFLSEYDDGYYADATLKIFARDDSGVDHPLTLSAVRSMAKSGSLPARRATNPRHR